MKSGFKVKEVKEVKTGLYNLCSKRNKTLTLEELDRPLVIQQVVIKKEV